MLYYEGIVQDITERKCLEDELKRQLIALIVSLYRSVARNWCSNSPTATDGTTKLRILINNLVMDL